MSRNPSPPPSGGSPSQETTLGGVVKQKFAPKIPAARRRPDPAMQIDAAAGAPSDPNSSSVDGSRAGASVKSEPGTRGDRQSRDASKREPKRESAAAPARVTFTAGPDRSSSRSAAAVTGARRILNPLIDGGADEPKQRRPKGDRREKVDSSRAHGAEMDEDNSDSDAEARGLVLPMEVPFPVAFHVPVADAKPLQPIPSADTNSSVPMDTDAPIDLTRDSSSSVPLSSPISPHDPAVKSRFAPDSAARIIQELQTEVPEGELPPLVFFQLPSHFPLHKIGQSHSQSANPANGPAGFSLPPSALSRGSSTVPPANPPSLSQFSSMSQPFSASLPLSLAATASPPLNPANPLNRKPAAKPRAPTGSPTLSHQNFSSAPHASSSSLEDEHLVGEAPEQPQNASESERLKEYKDIQSKYIFHPRMDHALRYLPSGEIGKLVVYKSGKVKLVIGNSQFGYGIGNASELGINMGGLSVDGAASSSSSSSSPPPSTGVIGENSMLRFDVSANTPPLHHIELVNVDSRGTQWNQFGEIGKRLIATLDVDHLIDLDRQEKHRLQFMGSEQNQNANSAAAGMPVGPAGSALGIPIKREA